MSLARVWMANLAGASAGALLAPAGLLAALAILALGGGISSLGSLGQLVSGPGVPPALPAGGSAGGVARAPALVAVLAAAPVTPAAPGPATGPLAGPSTQATPAIPVRASATGTTTGIPAAGSGKPTHRAPPPSRQPSVVDTLAGTGESLASSLPAPASTAVQQALSTVATTADGLLPPGKSGPAAPPAAIPALPTGR